MPGSSGNSGVIAPGQFSQRDRVHPNTSREVYFRRILALLPGRLGTIGAERGLLGFDPLSIFLSHPLSIRVHSGIICSLVPLSLIIFMPDSRQVDEKQ